MAFQGPFLIYGGLPVIARMPCPLLDKSFPDTVLVKGKKEHHLCRAGLERSPERTAGRDRAISANNVSSCR